MCCRGNYGVYIFPRDILPICRYLKIDSVTFLRDFCKAEYLNTSKGNLKIYTLIHRDMCQFLTSENLCDIYEVRPSQCRFAPDAFLYHPALWRHMTCFQERTSTIIEEIITPIERDLLLELIQIGYSQFEKEM